MNCDSNDNNNSKGCLECCWMLLDEKDQRKRVSLAEHYQLIPVPSPLFLANENKAWNITACVLVR